MIPLLSFRSNNKTILNIYIVVTIHKIKKYLLQPQHSNLPKNSKNYLYNMVILWVWLCPFLFLWLSFSVCMVFVCVCVRLCVPAFFVVGSVCAGKSVPKQSVRSFSENEPLSSAVDGRQVHSKITYIVLNA